MSIYYLDIRNKGNNILIRYIQDGVEKLMKYNKYKPVLYRLAYHGESSEYKEIINDEKVVPVEFNNIWDAKQELYNNKDKYYGNSNFHYTFLHEYFENNNFKTDEIRIFYIDIECPSEYGFPEASKAEWPIDALTIYDTLTGKYILWSLYDFNKDDKDLKENNITEDMIHHQKFNDEKSLMKSFLNYWKNNCPVAYTGWNSSGFDLPYIYNRLLRLGLDPNDLSPWGETSLREREFQGREILSVNILGVNDLDYLELYKKNRFITRESYKLGFIGQIEGIKDKVDFGDEASNLRTLNKVNPQKYQVYNIVDVQLVKLLDDKLGFMDITFYVAYFAGINYSDVSSPVATWNNIIYKFTIDDNIVLPPIRDHVSEGFQGGFVKDPIIGKHKWVISTDAASLYPLMIRGYNISPETMTDLFVPDVSVDSMANKLPFTKPNGDYTVCPSGITFSKEKQGILPKMMEILYKERKSIKKEMLVHEKNVIKIEEEIKRRGL